jgi:hypothetical protein
MPRLSQATLDEVRRLIDEALNPDPDNVEWLYVILAAPAKIGPTNQIATWSTNVGPMGLDTLTRLLIEFLETRDEPEDEEPPLIS